MSGRSDSRSETPRSSENQPDDDKQEGWPAKADQSAQQQPPPNSGWSSQPPGPAPPQQQQQTDALKNWDVSVNQGGKSWGGDNNQPTGQGPPPRSQGGWGGAPPPPQQQQVPPTTSASQPPPPQNEDWNQQQQQWGQQKNQQKNGWSNQSRVQPTSQAPSGWGAPPPPQNQGGWSGSETKQNTQPDQSGWNNGGPPQPNSQSAPSGWNNQSHESYGTQSAEQPRAQQQQAPPQPQQSSGSWNQGNTNDHFSQRDENSQEKIHSYGENSNLDEATQKKVNSNEGWGTSTIQQSTKWNVEETVPDARSRISSQSNGTEWWSEGHQMAKQAEQQRPPPPQVKVRNNDRGGWENNSRPSVGGPNPPNPNEWSQSQTHQHTWNQAPPTWPIDPPPRGPHGGPMGGNQWEPRIRPGGRPNYQPQNPSYRPGFNPGRPFEPDQGPGGAWDQHGPPSGGGGGAPDWDHSDQWGNNPQHNNWPPQEQQRQDKQWGDKSSNWKQKWNQNPGWDRPPMPDHNIWPAQPGWDNPGGGYDPNPGFNHNFNQNMQYLNKAAMMNLIPQQMLKDPACANNQTLIQLCKGVIYEGDKQRRLNAQMHNERYKQDMYPMSGNQNEIARIRGELSRAQSQEQHFRYKLHDFIGSLERKQQGPGGRQPRPFPGDQRNPDDNAQFSWPGGEKHIEKDLASEFGSKLNVGTSQISAPPDDSGPPAFEPGKPWPGSKHPNSEMMNPAKNRDLTPAEYNDMLRQTRANNVRHPPTWSDQQQPFSQHNEPWQPGVPPPPSYNPGGYPGWDEQRPSPSTKPGDFNAPKLPTDLLNQMSSGDN